MPRPDISVVVMGLSPTGLYAIRELGAAGHHVLGVGASGQAGGWSRYLQERIHLAEPAQRVQAILDRFGTRGLVKPVLIVTSDQDLDAVMDRAPELETRFHLQKSYVDGTARSIMDKESFYTSCAANGVSYPRVWQGTSEDAAALRNEIAYPCMVKPALIHAVKHLMQGSKGWILKTRDDFERIVTGIPLEAGTLLFQEIVPGPESEITLWCGYIDRDGKVRQRFTARKLRQYPPGFGSASLVQSHPEPETAHLAENLLATLGYRGIAAAEFKRHPEDGRLRIIEINPRPSLWFSASTAAGVPVTATAAADLRGETIPEMAEQRNGLRWRYGAKDMASALFYRRTPDFVLPPPDTETTGKARSHTRAVFSPADPGPLIGESLTIGAKGASRITKKLFGGSR